MNTTEESNIHTGVTFNHTIEKPSNLSANKSIKHLFNKFRQSFIFHSKDCSTLTRINYLH